MLLFGFSFSLDAEQAEMNERNLFVTNSPKCPSQE